MNDVVESIRAQLATYLATELAAQYPTLQTLDVWPGPSVALPEYAIAVLVAGPPETELHPPVKYKVTPTASPMGNVQYSYGWIEVPMQLDAWARYAAKRDQLAIDVRKKLNRPAAATLGVTPVRLHYQIAPELVLPVADLLDTPCNYAFEAAPNPIENGDAAQTNEWRATWTGNARMAIVHEETVPLIKKLELQIQANAYPHTKTILTP